MRVACRVTLDCIGWYRRALHQRRLHSGGGERLRAQGGSYWYRQVIRRSVKVLTKTQTHTLTKSRMEALSVLQREADRLQERRERLTAGISRIEQRMDNDRKWEEEVMSGSLEESARRSRAVTEERGRITKIREKIRKVDRQIRMWEERIERVRGAGERGEEESKSVLDEFEGAIRRASGRIEMEQKMLEQMWTELSDMRGYI